MSYRSDLHRVFCENVRALRVESGMTQTQLAERLGAKQSHVAGIESGKAAPGIELIERVAKALEVEPWELLANRVAA